MVERRTTPTTPTWTKAPMLPHPAADFAAAVGFLTLLPVTTQWEEGRAPRAVGWYPWVGMLLGDLVALPLWILARIHESSSVSRAFVLASLAVVAWSLLTRFLHWDGLADTFDGIWGGHTRDRRLEIMHDSRIGSFGAAAMLMAALLQVSALTVAISHGAFWPLVLAPTLGRLSVSFAAWTLPAARRDGLGLTVMDRPTGYDIGVALGALFLVCVAGLALGVAQGFAVAFAASTVVGLIAVYLMPRVLARSVDGMTGDLFGATVIIVETIVLLVSAVML